MSNCRMCLIKAQRQSKTACARLKKLLEVGMLSIEETLCGKGCRVIVSASVVSSKRELKEQRLSLRFEGQSRAKFNLHLSSTTYIEAWPKFLIRLFQVVRTQFRAGSRVGD